MKSLFGGWFKNKFSKAPPAPTVTASKSESKLSSHVENSFDDRYVPSNSGPTLSGESRATLQGMGSRFEAMDNKVDENLDVMSTKLANLRNLGKALGTEVDEQNDMLSRIQTKADRNDTVVRHQDNQMKKLLGYKGVPQPEDTAALSKKK